jgi:hypothetical protein
LQLLNKKGKALILSEYGVGGGIHQNGSVPAQTADEAAALPFFGIFGAYNPKTGVTAGFAAQACQLCFAMEGPMPCKNTHSLQTIALRTCILPLSILPEP